MMQKRSISAYTPSNTDAETRERIFVQRHQLLHKTVGWCEESMLTGNKHHVLFIGPRGCGKTHLVSMVHDRVSRNLELADKMRVAWLGEDTVFTGLIDLALEIADELAKEYPSEFECDYRANARSLSSNDAAEQILGEIVRRLGDKSILLVMENLDRAMRGLGDTGQKKWRAFLQEQGRVATVATSQQLFEDVSSRSAAFYGFFEIIHLEPLSVEDARELMERIALENDKQDLVEFLKTPEGRYRVRALHHLAGGNHRMYVLLSEFLTKESLDQLVACFEELADELTPYFQERLGSLSPQQARIVQSLCSGDGAMTVKEIAEDTFIAERNASRQLGELKQRGYVASEKRGKEAFYDMTEALMRLCLDVRKRRGKPIRLVAAFLRAWYSAEQKGLSLSKRGDIHAKLGDSDKAIADCSAVIEMVGISSSIRTCALFSLAEVMMPMRSLDESIESLQRAFQDGDPETSEYGGDPKAIIENILRREHPSWPEFIEKLIPVYAQYGKLNSLGSGLTESITTLDKGSYSEDQLDLWNSSWQKFGGKYEELSIPIAALDAAVQTIKSDSDRPLFKLPLEIRNLVRPLLKNTLSLS